MFSFYKPTYNPNHLTGTVGGSISVEPLSGYLDELFAHVSSPPSGIEGVYQYRKLFVVNAYAGTSTYTRVWLDQLDHPEQIAISLEASAGDSIANATTAPSGITTWYTPTNYVDGVQIGTLTYAEGTGMWVRQYLTGVIEEDPFATCRIYVGGVIE